MVPALANRRIKKRGSGRQTLTDWCGEVMATVYSYKGKHINKEERGGESGRLHANKRS